MTSVVMSRPGARNIRFRPLRQVRRWVVDSKDLLFIDLTRDPKLADASADIDVAVKVIRSEGLSHLRRWLATLNGENYSVEWWSHNCTAKNPLSSPLIMRALDVMACISLIDAQPLRDVVICGATPGQQRSIEAHYGINKFCYNISSLVGTYVKKLFSLAKCIL